MPFDPEISFIKSQAQSHLEKFTDEIRNKSGEQVWRCLYSLLSPEIVKDYSRKNIVSTFLKNVFASEADDMKVFWLESGHMFIFFQGPVRAVIKNYESFLDFVNEGARPDYHFFWEIHEFWGYFDQVLAKALDEKPVGRDLEMPPQKTDPISSSPDLLRVRQSRYKPLLLIVEDDRVTRHMLQAAMEKYCDIAVAWSAKQAREFYGAMLPNIVFLDIELPDGDGQELAEMFCAHDPDSFVVMVSGTLDTENTRRCLKAGVKGTVAKPAQEKQLLGFIDQYHKTRQKKAALR